MLGLFDACLSEIALLFAREGEWGRCDARQIDFVGERRQVTGSIFLRRYPLPTERRGLNQLHRSQLSAAVVIITEVMQQESKHELNAVRRLCYISIPTSLAF